MNIVPPQQQVSIAGASSESVREAARMRYRCRVASPRGMDLALVNRDAAKTRYFLVGALTTNHPSPHLPFSHG